MTTSIRFGTDGWRAIIAEDFTFANVARCAQGLVDYLRDEGIAEKGLVVGYDTRFLSREFAETVVSVCAGNGVPAFLTEAAAPTPVVSYSVLDRQAAGAAIITASHNPGNWNGFKFKPEYAGSATDEITRRLEGKIEQASQPRLMPLGSGIEEGLIAPFDPKPAYLERLASLVDLTAIRSAGLTIMVDSMFGAGSGYLYELLAGHKTSVTELNGTRNPAFPGMDQPEPIAHNLTTLMAEVPESRAAVGIALDGDADRVGIVDENGVFLSTLQVFSLLAYYLLEHKGQRAPIVKGITSSMMLDKLARKYGVEIYDMPVGFKHIGPTFSEVDGMMGGEESGGFAFQGHIPERDGILSALYFLEFLVRTGKTPSQLVEELFSLVGPHYYQRRDVTFDAAARQGIQARLESVDLQELGGYRVVDSDNIDGRRLFFDNAWLASRFSGTEPLLRIYCEAESPQLVNALLDAAAAYLGV
ncbi:MAG: phosphoglucomutase/phosphomannomutase family protein [Chloroflexi bacterium]|nr:phosphoglucomutase/phosphomannomutase family protein [Chloroflexota bacterium]